MREIKFRAWRKGKGEMYFVRVLYSDGWVVLDSVDGSFAPDTVELVQYTGLEDSKGREIYEGDIVTAIEDGEELYTAVVEWCEQEVGYRLYQGFAYKSTPHFKDMPSWEAINWVNLKVIGNKFENKDLLEE